MKVKVLNAFSLSMLDCESAVHLRIELVPLEIALRIASEERLESFIGHESTAKIVSKMLGVDLSVRRESVKLSRNEAVLVAQYCGPRLPEGCTELPSGAEIRFFLVMEETNSVLYGEMLQSFAAPSSAE